MKPIWEMTKKEILAFNETVDGVPHLARKDYAYRGKGDLYELDGHFYHELDGIVTHTIHTSAHRCLIDEAMLAGKLVPDEVKKDYIGMIFDQNLAYLWPELLQAA
ncbi:hypothetical protein [Paenibacillus prosopidis]|uniref:Uncharacterized protein n=1 Tax=Paenibacillus prosopidis TaxID=630520 RepID=A0A368VJ89_9BACL|nr:hypothetical protein [Paenibacillus prosopidis]RCW41623.1 hypothetical protein DFP97_12259 [Paenibacillus prosopidis]